MYGKKNSKKLKIWFFQKISIFCLLVTSKMICFHNLEVPRLDLGHFSGKIFDDVFEIFGRGPKSHFWSKNAKMKKVPKFFSPSLFYWLDDSNEYKNMSKSHKNDENIKIFTFGKLRLYFSFQRVGLKIDLLWVLKTVFWWNQRTSRLPMDHPNSGNG